MTVQKKRAAVFAIAAAVILILIFFPYLKAEYLTLRHGGEFSGLQRQTKMLGESDYYKVVSYSKEKASVFYVSDTGDLLAFEKDDNGEWQLDEWKTIWSRSGSADSFYYPYYR